MKEIHQEQREAMGPVSQRAPAPGELKLVQAFLNSVDREEGIEYFSTPERFRHWLVEHDLMTGNIDQVEESDRLRAIDLREALREVVGANTGQPVADDAADRLVAALGPDTGLIPVAGEDGTIRLVPNGDGLDAAFARMMAICNNARFDGTWARFKLCRDPECRWAFYDASKNGSSVWCDMAICGSRNKARAYRTRKKLTG